MSGRLDTDAQTVDARQIDTGPTGQSLALIELNAQLAAGSGHRPQIELVPPAFIEQGIEPCIALAAMAGNVVVHRERLFEYEQVLIAPVILNGDALDFLSGCS